MATVQLDKRTRLVRSAVKLVYTQGFNRTTIADIAEDASVPLGNVYYYFKTKDEIGQMVIEARAGQYRSLRARWDRYPDPKKRLRAFIHLMLDNRPVIARHGCPIGSLCSELHKDGGPLARQATGIMREWVDWMELQFRALGKKKAARDLALHLMSALQGANLLAQSFRDQTCVEREAHRLVQWVYSL